MQAKHKNTGRWEGVKLRLSHFQVCLPRGKKMRPRGFKDPQLPNSRTFMNQPYPLRALRTRNWGV
jgi:hypothetical protein